VVTPSRILQLKKKSATNPTKTNGSYSRRALVQSLSVLLKGHELLEQDFAVDLPDGRQLGASEIFFQNDKLARLELLLGRVFAVVLLSGAFRFLLVLLIFDIILVFIFIILCL